MRTLASEAAWAAVVVLKSLINLSSTLGSSCRVESGIR